MDSRSFGYVLGILLLPIIFGFAYIGQLERGLFVVVLMATFGGVAYVKRNILKRTYFIVTMIALFAPQLLVVLILRLPSGSFPGIALFPVAVIDVFVIHYVLKFVEKALGVESTES